MNKVFSAKTVEEAKALASREFNVVESKIRFEILEEPKRGLFGITRGEARVSAEYEPGKADVAVSYIEGILKAMDIDTKVTMEEVEGGVQVEIEGDGIGTVIGRRGETLDAIQYLASMVCNKNDKDYYRISVDSCGYREKRKETLEELAVKISKSVLKTGRTSSLEPMNPYERRIIHSAVATVEGVTSRSVGEEPYRKVIISSLKKPERPPRRDRPNGPGAPGRDNRSGKPRSNNPVGNAGNNRNNQRGGRPDGGNRPPRAFDLKTSFEKEYVKPTPKPKPEDEMTSELYGKIKID